MANGVGTARTLVLMDRQTTFDCSAPERVVTLVVEGLDRMIGRHCRQHHAANDVVLTGPPQLVDRRVDVVRKELDQPTASVGQRLAELDQPTIVGAEPGPSPIEL